MVTKLSIDTCENCGNTTGVLHEEINRWTPNAYGYGCLTCNLAGWSHDSMDDAKRHFMAHNVAAAKAWIEAENKGKCKEKCCGK
jgi:hypothetical protein